jgi:predicted DNA-binding protein (MmcQ/YjbR family)
MKADAIYSTPPAVALLTRLRKIFDQLKDVKETVTFGHPTFQVGGKTFAVFELYKGELGLALKVEKELQQVFLKDPRFYFTPYSGKHGWVTLRMNSKPLDWKEIRELVKGSHRLAVPVKKKS